MLGRTYRYMKNEALFPFGYGLTYSDYDISDVKASTDVIGESGVEISLKIKNTGKYELLETLQIYVRYENGGETAPNHALKHFEKVKLLISETKEINITLPQKAFALADENGIFNVGKGKYTVYIGCSQPDTRSVKLTGNSPVAISIRR